MATMNRNVNLEEINSEAFMGIPYLNYQSMGQKAVFWGSVCVGIGINLLGTFRWHISSMAAMCLMMAPLLAGVALGCNYNQDMSLLSFFLLLILKPKELYLHKPCTGVPHVMGYMAECERADSERAARESVTQEQRRKSLIRLIAAAVAIVAVFCILLALIYSTRGGGIVMHHSAK